MGIYKVLPAWIWTREVGVEFGPLPCLCDGFLLPPLPTPAHPNAYHPILAFTAD